MSTHFKIDNFNITWHITNIEKGLISILLNHPNEDKQ